MQVRVRSVVRGHGNFRHVEVWLECTVCTVWSVGHAFFFLLQEITVFRRAEKTRKTFQQADSQQPRGMRSFTSQREKDLERDIQQQREQQEQEQHQGNKNEAKTDGNCTDDPYWLSVMLLSHGAIFRHGFFSVVPGALSALGNGHQKTWHCGDVSVVSVTVYISRFSAGWWCQCSLCEVSGHSVSDGSILNMAMIITRQPKPVLIPHSKHVSRRSASCDCAFSVLPGEGQ